MIEYRVLLDLYPKGAYDMMRLQILQRRRFTILFLAGTLSLVTAKTLIETS